MKLDGHHARQIGLALERAVSIEFGKSLDQHIYLQKKIEKLSIEDQEVRDLVSIMRLDVNMF